MYFIPIDVFFTREYDSRNPALKEELMTLALGGYTGPVSSNHDCSSVLE